MKDENKNSFIPSNLKMRIVRRITTSSRNRDWSAFTENVLARQSPFLRVQNDDKRGGRGVLRHEIEEGRTFFRVRVDVFVTSRSKEEKRDSVEGV